MNVNPKPPSSPRGRLTILVVDDEPNIRKMLSVAMTTEGHHVIGVTNSRDAVVEAARRSFDLAFVDLRLGTETGLDLISKLLSESPWLRVVVITAYATIDTESLLQLLPQIRLAGIRRATPSPNQ